VAPVAAARADPASGRETRRGIENIRCSADHRTRSRYADAALRHAINRVARAPVGIRNHALNSEAYSLGRLIAAELLHGQVVGDALAAAAMAAGLVPRETYNW
jgi:uncharacterized membrane protein YebE (DUF533 family)